jgi:hypothetical protein
MTVIPVEVTALAEERQMARANKDFARSDQLRDQIVESGWLIKDTSDGYLLTVAPPFVITAHLGAFVDQNADSVSDTTVVLVIVDGWPEDTHTSLTALLEYAPSHVRVLAVDCGNIDGAGVVVHELAKVHKNLDEFHFAQRLTELGWANVVNAAVAVSASEFFAVMDLSTIWEGDALTPLLEVFADPQVALSGWRGVNVDVSQEWREFTPATEGSVDAILGYFLMVRSSVAREIGPDSKASFYRNADMEWSLAIRAAGYEVVIPEGELPLRQERHHGYHDSDPEYREKQSKKTYDRLLQKFRKMPEILHKGKAHGN